MLKYKIFVDAHILENEFQGTRTYVTEIYKKILTNKNITVIFGAKYVDNIVKEFGDFNNAEIIKYKSSKRLINIYKEIPQIIDKMKCTHAHFQYVMPFKKNKKCKYIVTIHDVLFNEHKKEFSFLYRKVRKNLFYLSIKKSEYILTVSNYSKKSIMKYYKVKPEKIIITPNAVSDRFIKLSNKKRESRKHVENKYGMKKYILYVSRIEPRKNQRLLLQIFLELKLWQKGLSLVFIGNNTIDSGLLDGINKLTINEKEYVKWIQQVDYEDLGHFLNAAEIFVYPSKAEGFGIPPLEAGILLTPVLCSNATAMKDFNFFEPHMFNPQDSKEFKSKLLYILDNKETINLKKIRDDIINKYTWDNSANILLNKVIKNG